MRRSLSDKSVRANTILGSWATIPDLVHEAELIALFDTEARKLRRAKDVSPRARGAAEFAAKVVPTDVSDDEDAFLGSGEDVEESADDN